MQIEMKLASESHVPRFRAGVGTWRSRYMISIRLPWRHRARPSATLHEILSAPKSKLVFTMVHGREGFVKRELRRPHSKRADQISPLSFRRASEARQEDLLFRRLPPGTFPCIAASARI